MLVLFSGSSGVGKTECIEGLLDKSKTYKLFKSYTTRSPRINGENISTLIHISKAEFERKIENDEMAEYIEYSGNYYGVDKKSFFDAIESDIIYLKDVDVCGHEKLVKLANTNNCLVSIFLTAEKEEIKKRLISKGNRNNIEERIARYDYEQSFAKNYDYILKNEILCETIDKADKFIKDKRNKINASK